MYTNADSLRNKLEELKFRIEQESERPNVICITEYKAKTVKSLYLNSVNMVSKDIHYSITAISATVREE